MSPMKNNRLNHVVSRKTFPTSMIATIATKDKKDSKRTPSNGLKWPTFNLLGHVFCQRQKPDDVLIPDLLLLVTMVTCCWK